MSELMSSSQCTCDCDGVVSLFTPHTGQYGTAWDSMGQYGPVWASTLASPSPQEAGVQLLTHHVIITPTHTSPGDTGEALLDAECSVL